MRICPLVSAILAYSLATAEAFNSSNIPQTQVFYYSQWACYGERSPPGNTGGSMGGTYKGRWFYLDDFIGRASEFYAPGTQKVINFSFAGIDMDSCKVMSVDFWADFMLGVGTAIGSKCGTKGAGYTNGVWSNEQNAMVGGSDDLQTGHACVLRALKQKDPSWKIAISIGGWTMSSEFSRCTRDAAKRAVLVNSLQYFVDRFAIDIVDIDWEYPSKMGCEGSEADFCKMIISRGKNYQPNIKVDSDKCDPGAIYQLYDTLKQKGFPKVIQDIDRYGQIGQAVSTADNCKNYHKPNWGNIPSGVSGMAEYWKGSITNRDWVYYIQLLTDFANASYNGKKMIVTTAVGMDSCSSIGTINGKECGESPGFRMFPAFPKGQGVSLKTFCEIQGNSGGFVNVMTYDFNGNWGPPYHNAPLFDNPYLRKHPDYLYEFNVDSSVKNWLTKSSRGNQYENDGCLPGHINIGLALYGRTYSKANAFGTFEPKRSTQTLGVGTYQAGVVSLWDVRNRFLSSAQGGKCESSGWGNEHCGKWTLKRDVYAGCVPWLEKRNSDGSYEIISFDDDYSLGLKAKWARCLGARGLMYWDAADDQDGLGAKASWQAWQTVSLSECPALSRAPSSCPNAPGQMVCFGKPNDICDGTGPEGGGGTTQTTGSPINSTTTTTTTTTYPHVSEEGCPTLQECYEKCLNFL